MTMCDKGPIVVIRCDGASVAVISYDKSLIDVTKVS
jgi:hypothetical protein